MLNGFLYCSALHLELLSAIRKPMYVFRQTTA